MDAADVDGDLVNILFTEEDIQNRLAEMARAETTPLVVDGVMYVTGPRNTAAALDVLLVDEISDTGLTLGWLTANLASRSAASVEICTLLRKPEALQMQVEVKYVGWDIPNEFVVGYGLDYNEKYRNLRDIGTLAPHVYS